MRCHVVQAVVLERCCMAAEENAAAAAAYGIWYKISETRDSVPDSNCAPTFGPPAQKHSHSLPTYTIPCFGPSHDQVAPETSRSDLRGLNICHRLITATR